MAKVQRPWIEIGGFSWKSQFSVNSTTKKNPIVKKIKIMETKVTPLCTKYNLVWLCGKWNNKLFEWKYITLFRDKKEKNKTKRNIK